jgi:omega-6 fatty acid desaturase (delta-12 desaturase)
MRTAKEILIASKQYAHEHRLLSWWHLGSTIAVYVALILLACLDLSSPARILASLLAGLVQVRLFVLYHDFQHRAILSGSRVAAAFMHAFGIYSLSPPSYWNYSHNHHHKNNAKQFGVAIGSFDVMTTEDFAKAPRGTRCLYIASRHPLTIALGYLTVFLYNMCLRPWMQNPRTHTDGALAFGLHLGLVAALAYYDLPTLLLAVILPFTIAMGLGSYLFYAQHNFPKIELCDQAEWSYVHAALHSSSFIRMSRMMRWFTGNIGYHHVHHLNARIPFYRLPEAMAGIAELQSPGATSLRLRDIMACLRLKLWDREQNRLVSFTGA